MRARCRVGGAPGTAQASASRAIVLRSWGYPSHASLASLEFIECLWPVLAQEPRERPICEQLSLGLALRAIVHFVFTVDDALYGRSTGRAGLAEPAMHRHALVERGYLLRKVAAGLLLKLQRPFRKRGAGCQIQHARLLRGQLARLPQRRQPGAMQDLVR